MSTHQTKTWLVAYDIRETPRRRRVHRLLRRRGLAAQYSAFTVEADDTMIEDILDALQNLIDPRRDDVRAYHLPLSCPVWRLGNQHWPDGVHLAPNHAARLLLETAADGATDETDLPDEWT